MVPLRPPPPSCPDGAAWDGAKCVRTDVEVRCPPGSHRDGAACVADVRKDCQAGMRFVDGQGCVAIGSSAAPGMATFAAANREWQRDVPKGRYTWREAYDYCAGLGGGFRLPTKDELSDLYDAKAPGTRDRDEYWSSTGAGDMGGGVETACIFRFEYGQVALTDVRERLAVRCAR